MSKIARKLGIVFTVCLMTMFVVSCGSTGPARNSFCQTEEARILTEEELNTKPIEKLREDLSWNKYGEKKCNWRGV